MALSPDALKVADNFGHAPGVTKVHVDQLKKLFADSPELARQLNEAVDQKLVSSFQPLTDPHMRGSFDPASCCLQKQRRTYLRISALRFRTREAPSK